MRFAFIIFCFLFYPIILFSQNFKGGLSGGFVTSQVDGDRFGGYDKSGVTFGAFVNHRVSKLFYAQLELKYIQKGSRKNPDFEKGDNVFYRMKLQYIECPIYIIWDFRKKIKFEAGLAGGYLFKSTEDLDGYGDRPANPPFRQFEISGSTGVDYFLSDHFSINLRFCYSILPIRSHPGNQTYFFNRGQYNNLLNFVVYYQF